jgi:hypothetical protein
MSRQLSLFGVNQKISIFKNLKSKYTELFGIPPTDKITLEINGKLLYLLSMKELSFDYICDIATKSFSKSSIIEHYLHEAEEPTTERWTLFYDEKFISADQGFVPTIAGPNLSYWRRSLGIEKDYINIIFFEN